MKIFGTVQHLGVGKAWSGNGAPCQCVLFIRITDGQVPMPAVGAGGVLGNYFFPKRSFLSPSLWETARNRLKYCIK